MSVLGVDVSHWNPEPLPWAAWRDRVAVVGIKLTGGLWPDVQASAHLAAAKAAGYTTLFGYHYLLGMAGQAAKFLAALGPDFKFAMLDVEEPGLTEPLMRAFCDYYDAHETRPLVLYGNSGLLGPLMAQNPARYARYGVVWAEYGPDKPTSAPPYPAPTTAPAGLKLTGWQFAGRGGRLAPYAGAIDLTAWFEMPGQTPEPPIPAITPAEQATIAQASADMRALAGKLEGIG